MLNNSSATSGRKRGAGQKSGQSRPLCGWGYFCLDFFYLLYQDKRLKSNIRMNYKIYLDDLTILGFRWKGILAMFS